MLEKMLFLLLGRAFC